MFNVADITNATGIYLDTSGTGHTFTVHEGRYDISIPSSTIFNESGTTKEGITNTSNVVLKQGDFVGDFIESTLGLGAVFSNFITTFKNIVFSIHYLCAPFFGDFNSWVLEAVVDFVLVIGFFQIVTGRSFKTME